MTTLTEPTIRYRKLPGRRRGLIIGSSVWLAPDHLLLVKSQRVQEEYKRYYFRDIKAIAIVRTSRFHISTRSLAIGATWLLALVNVYVNRVPWAAALWLVPLLLAILWIYISLEESCRCRIYTAVSADELPSIYRSWTARRFLAAVEPRIREIQGELPEGWAQALSNDAAPLTPPATVSPALTPAALVPPAEALPPSPTASARPAGSGARRTLVSDAFLVSLLAGALLDLTQAARLFPAPQWMLAAILLLQLGSAVGVVVQRNRGTLVAGLQKPAIAKLVWSGVAIYLVRSVLAGLAAARSAATGGAFTPFSFVLFPDNQALFATSAAIDVILAVFGAVTIGRSRQAADNDGLFSTEL